MLGWLTVDEITETLKQHSEYLYVVITGRDIPAELINFVNVATEVKEIKRHFRHGIRARMGIGY